MYIKDLNGKKIEVTDLAKAIRQAKSFKQYSHDDGGFSELDKELSIYWADMHEKLLQLQSNLKI